MDVGVYIRTSSAVIARIGPRVLLTFLHKVEVKLTLHGADHLRLIKRLGFNEELNRESVLLW